MKDLKTYISEGIFDMIDADMGEVMVDSSEELAHKYLAWGSNGVSIVDGKIAVGILNAMGLNNLTDKNYRELMSGEHIHYIGYIKEMTIGDDRNKLSSLNSGPVLIESIGKLSVRINRDNTFDIENTQIEIKRIGRLIIYMDSAFYDAKKLSDFLNKTKVDVVDIRIIRGEFEGLDMKGIKCNILSTTAPASVVDVGSKLSPNMNTGEWYDKIMKNNNIKKLFIRYTKRISNTKYYWVKKKGDNVTFTLQRDF